MGRNPRFAFRKGSIAEDTYSFGGPWQYVVSANTRSDMGGTASGRRAARRSGLGLQVEMKKGRNSPFVFISARTIRPGEVPAHVPMYDLRMV